VPDSQETDRSRLLTPPDEEDSARAVQEDPALKFTDVMNDLQRVYPKPVMDDISTSYCFICLLHLANEKGLVISKTAELNELDVRKDWTADLALAGE
jgi:condensin complex subunit 2